MQKLGHIRRREGNGGGLYGQRSGKREYAYVEAQVFMDNIVLVRFAVYSCAIVIMVIPSVDTLRTSQ